MDRESFEETCRICLSVQRPVFSLYKSRGGRGAPREVLWRVARLATRPGDGAPPGLCARCLQDLDTAEAFLDRCERAAHLLQRFVNQQSSPADEPVAVSVTPLLQDSLDTVEISTDLKRKACDKCGDRKPCSHRPHTGQRTCPYCQKTFTKKYNYQIHVDRHTGGGTFRCPTCGVEGLSRWRAAAHCRPPASRACPAPSCLKTFTSNNNLRTHLLTHTGEKPFECNECGKRFISKNILVNHLRTHTGVRPYMCEICGARFATNKLALHRATHASASATAPASASAAARPHRCMNGHCARAFRTPRDLREHSRTHSASRAFPCARCGAAYKHKQSLRNHVRHAHADQVKSAVTTTENKS